MIHEPDWSAKTLIWEPLPPAKTEVPQSEAPAPTPRLWPLQSFLCALLCICVLGCKLYAPAAAQTLQQLLIGTGESRLRTAAACFEDALQQSGSLGSAIGVFCDEIILP